MYTKSTEEWMAYWKESALFVFKEDDEARPLCVIDTPPPFTSGELHMGQAYWVSYVDSIARYMRMSGYNVLYPVGWDTQGFPTEMQVEKKYGKGLGREEFYSKCVDIATANMQAMRRQMLSMGASFDDNHEYVTMSPEYRRKVQLSLLKMHEKGFVYRSNHPVEWCPHCNTSIAREEINDLERESYLNYINFKMGDASIEIATTRPELMHACVAIAVNPNDSRYKHMIGKKAEVPIFGNKVSVIADDLVEKDFGTGAEMVCTYGDKNDVMMFYKHKLAFIDALDERGMLKNAGKFTGMPSKDAGEAIIKELDGMGLLVKREKTVQTVKTHDRCGTPIELISSVQWFIKTKEYADRIKESSDSITWIPEYAKQRLIDWANYIEWDWSISRNRVFGTPLPFWYCNSCGTIIPPKEEDLPVNPAIEPSKVSKCPKCGSTDIVGEKNTCDVWVDSSITPLVVAGWPDNKKLFEKAYPATFRIQGTDIVRTWAFYTIFRNWALMDSKPFERILVHGMILGTDGKEMHKSLGNGVGPKELIDKYGIDAVRLWVALSGSAGKDKVFRYEDLDYTKSFVNKLYNSALFVKTALAEDGAPRDLSNAEKHMGVFDVWITNRLNATIKEVRAAYDSMDLYTAMSKLINFYWHEFCDYYLEDVKYRIYDKTGKMKQSASTAAFTLKYVLENSLKMLAPVMPFISEEVFRLLDNSTSIFAQSMPEYKERAGKADYVINGVIFANNIVDIDYEDAGAFLNIIISDVRKAKSGMKLSLNKEISAININVPEAYYSVVAASEAELKGICNAKALKLSKSNDYSTTIEA